MQKRIINTLQTIIFAYKSLFFDIFVIKIHQYDKNIIIFAKSNNATNYL